MPTSLKTALREVSRNLLVLVALGGMATVALAFTEPSVGPTGGSVNAPVNTGGTAQTKIGNFTSSGTVTGNILNATTQVSSPRYCIGASCITAWPSGTTNYLSKFTSAISLGNSQIYDNGTNVGIGTAGPAGAKLEVAGQVKITGGSPGTGKVLTSDVSGLASWATPSGGGMYDNLNWVVMTRVDGNQFPVGTSIMTAVPNYWTVPMVQAWLRGSADEWGWRIAANFLAFSPTQTYIGSDGWPNPNAVCNAQPPAIPTNRPCFFWTEAYGTDIGTWANNGAGIMVTTAKKLGIGTPNPGAGLEINTDVIPLKLQNTTSAVGQHWLVGPNNLNAFQVINQNNIGMYMNNGATSWTATSDGRLKENVSPITGALQKVLHMRGVTYNFKYNSRRELGVIAQEVQPYFPELVTVGPDTEYLGVSYDRIAPVLIEAIKEQQKEIDSLKARIEALEKNRTW